MVKRTFLTLSVFLGSLAGIFWCNVAVRGEQDSASVTAQAPCESWSYGYEGCWYDDTSNLCPYHMVEAPPTPAPAEEQVAEKPCDAPVVDEAKYDGYEAKYYGYQWEYDDYDSAYEDYGWSEPIAESQAETEVIETEVAAAATVDESGSDEMDDYDYWSEYYDDEYRYFEASAQPAQEATTEICTDGEQSLTETINEEPAVEAAIDAGCFDPPADNASQDWQDQYDDHDGYGYEYGYEYRYAHEYEPKFDRTEEVVEVNDELIETETIEVAEVTIEAEMVEVAEETTEAEIVEVTEVTTEAEIVEVVEETIRDASSDSGEAHSDEYDDYHGCYYGDCYYGYDDYGYGDCGYGDCESSLSPETPGESAIEETTDGEGNDSPVLRQAAILTLARSLDQMGSALQLLSRQLTEMATPEVAARSTMTVTDQH